MVDYRKIIIEKRIMMSISQRKLSMLVGISQPHMNKIENGLRGVSVELLQKFCNTLDIEVTFRKE